jgi:probable HAF family extracellular repeat protein
MRLAILAGVGSFSLLLAACDPVNEPAPSATQPVRVNVVGALKITMRDLGTLGGNFSTTTAINRWGAVVGYSRTAAGEMHAFRWDGITMHDLGTLGGNFSRAVDINDVGQIAGTARVTVGTDCEQGGPITDGCRAFRWDATNGMQALPTLGGDFAAATDINELGHIAGFSTTGTGEKHAFYWDGTTMHDVGTLDEDPDHHDDWSVARAVNDRGRVVGVSTTPFGEFHAFVWDYQTGRMRDLGTFGGTFSQALAVNRRGEVAGYAYTSDEKRHAFFWDGWSLRDLGTLDNTQSDNESEGVAMNRWGDVVGSAEGPPFTGREHPFIWNASHGMRDLGTLGLVINGQLVPDGHATAINDLTEVVGDYGVENSCSAPGGCNAFYWDGVLHDLGRLGDRDSHPVDLNTRGQIVGVSQTPDDDPIHPRETHAVLWTVRY